MIPNVNTIMGIPVLNRSTKWIFERTTDTKSAKLLFGYQTYNYDKNIVWPGFIETNLLYLTSGIPIFFMVAGAAVTSTGWYEAFIKNTNNIAAAAQIGFAGGSRFGYAAVKRIKKACIMDIRNYCWYYN
jgi:hypothetical protein